MVQACNPSTLQVESRRSGVRVQPWLHSNSERHWEQSCSSALHGSERSHASKLKMTTTGTTGNEHHTSLLVLSPVDFCVTKPYNGTGSALTIIPKPRSHVAGSSQNCTNPSTLLPLPPLPTHQVCSPRAHSRRERLQGDSLGQTPHSPQGAEGSWRRGTPGGKSPAKGREVRTQSSQGGQIIDKPKT